MSIKSKILPFVPYGLVMKYHYRNANPYSIETEICSGKKYNASFDKERKIISIQGTGYSGSGAVIDLMREYDNNLVMGAYELENNPEKSHLEITQSPCLEFDILRHSGGIIELGLLLPMGNIFVNDAAIHRFIEFIDYWLKELNGRTPISSQNFREIVATFLDAIILQRIPMGNQTAFNPHLYKQAKKSNYIYITKNLSQQQYYEIAQRFVYQMFSLFDTKRNLIFDQLLSDGIYNEAVFSNYLPNYKIIQVLRDPRDVYATAINNSVSWIPKSNSSDFICWYRHLVETLKSSERLKIIRFEDLVKKYDHTVEDIESFLNLHPSQHIRKFDFFDPNISKKNIGLYSKLSNNHSPILRDIEKNLPDYCYEHE